MIVCVLGKPAQVILLYLSAGNIDKCNAFSEFNTFFTFNAFQTGLRASPQSFEMMLRNAIKSTLGRIFRIISQANLKGISQDINQIQEIFFQKNVFVHCVAGSHPAKILSSVYAWACSSVN